MPGPHHLAKFDTTHDNNFNSEVVYRRCPFGSRIGPPYKVEELFLDIGWEDLTQGLSVNRSKYAQPEDALWAYKSEDHDKKKCEYEEKKGIIYESNTQHYPVKDIKTGVEFTLSHSPVCCNISHCDILANNIPIGPNKSTRRDIRAFLATFFQDLTAKNMTKTGDVETELNEDFKGPPST